jgi:ADP-ribose pyrophosphatase YjhB (NUDIX family)
VCYRVEMGTNRTGPGPNPRTLPVEGADGHTQGPTRVGVAVLVTDSLGRLLLGRRGKEPNYGMWVIPGGGVERGESWCETAQRELLEETGLEVRVDRGQRPYILEILNETEHRLILCVTGTVQSGVLRPASDLLDARFFATDQIPANISPVVRPALAEFGWNPT